MCGQPLDVCMGGLPTDGCRPRLELVVPYAKRLRIELQEVREKYWALFSAGRHRDVSLISSPDPDPDDLRPD